MSMHERVSGTYKLFLDAHANVSGTWKRLTDGYERVGGVWKRFWQYALHVTTITIGDDGVAHAGYAQGLYGSLGDATYDDRGLTSRLIKVVIWDFDADDDIQIVLDTASVPNNDTTFRSIIVGGVEFLRSAATYNGSFAGGTGSQWFWSGVDTSAIPPSGSTSLVIT